MYSQVRATANLYPGLLLSERCGAAGKTAMQTMLVRHLNDAGNVRPVGELQTLASLRKSAYLQAENPRNAISHNRLTCYFQTLQQSCTTAISDWD